MAAFADCKRITNYQDYQFDDFHNENALCDFIQDHAEEFAKGILEIEYKGHEREFCISGDRRVSNLNSKGRVDFCFHSDGGLILVECKNPNHVFAEAAKSIGQVLAYSCLADRYNLKVSRFVLVTSHYNPILKEITDKYSLPIDIYVFNKKYVLKLLR